MSFLGRRIHGVLALLFALGVCCSPAKPKVVRVPPRPVPRVVKAAPSAEPVLGEVTLQGALEAVWDGDFAGCQRLTRQVLRLAPKDLESVELMLRCANAQRTLPEAMAWLRAAYGRERHAPALRYGEAMDAWLRGQLAAARKGFEAMSPTVPAAAYQGALVAQLEDDPKGGEALAQHYVKAHPDDPAGRALLVDLVCAVDVTRCEPLLISVRSGDEEPVAVARRLGAAVNASMSLSRARLASLALEADGIRSAAFSDALALSAIVREGGDPATVLVRSPRSGRAEPGTRVDLVRDARPLSRLPFVTRVLQANALNDGALAVAFHARLIGLFPVEIETWRVAKRSDKTALAARKELEKGSFVRWRALLASVLARADEACQLATAFAWDDRGPLVSALRTRCEIASDPTRGRRLAETRMAGPSFGTYDIETTIEALTAVKDPAALEQLGRRIIRETPSSSLGPQALWAAADLLPRRADLLYADALAQLSYDPTFSRRILRRYVDNKDVARAKSIIAQSAVEAPLDAYLCGVQGEILLHEGKSEAALQWLLRSCLSARARRDQETLSSTLASLGAAVGRAKDRSTRDAAMRCLRGD